MRTEKKLQNIVDKDDKDLMKMIDFIKRSPRVGLMDKKFKVFTLETSRGKTTGSAFGMIQAIETNKNKYIFTTKTLKECERFAEMIADEFEEAANDIVMAYSSTEMDSEFFSTDFDECLKARILILTHAMYLLLCNPKDDVQKEISEKVKNNFDVLIIDEELNAVTCNLCNYNEFIYQSTLNLIKSTNNKDILYLFDKLCELPKKTIEFYENKDELKDKILVAEELEMENVFTGLDYDNLIKLVNSIDDEVINDYNSQNNTDITKNKIREGIEKINTLYMNIAFDQVLYWNKTLYSCNFNFKFLMLDKNIMLDASANFNTVYDSSLFDVVKSKRVIDHSNCYLLWHNINTSKSAKRGSSDKKQLTNWRKFIIEDMMKKAKIDTKILIITNKEECKGLEERFINDEFKNYFKEYAMLNFFNMRGVDTYANYDEIFLIHTHRFPLPIYVLMYMYYIMKDDIDILKLNMSYGKFRGSNTISFQNKNLDNLLWSDEISSLYQAGKRICRSKNPNGCFHIYNSNFEVIKAIKEELYNVKIIPDEDNKKAKLCDDFYFIVCKVRDGELKDYLVTEGKKKVKAVKRGKKKYYEVNKKLFYELLNINSKNFARDIIKKIDEKELKIKFNDKTIKVNF